MSPPWKQLRHLWRTTWAVRAAAYGLRCLTWTLRPVHIQRHFEQQAWDQGTPIVLAVWHGRLLYLFRNYYRQRRRFTVLVSQSRDGEFISQMLHACSVDTTRGSSSRGGARAILELRRKMRQGLHAMIIPDGPRGPRYQVQPGILMVAAKTGATILPVTYSARWKKILPSWDRFMLPLPFSRVVVVYGAPLSIAAPLTPALIQTKQRELEHALRTITDLADAYCTA